MNGRMATIAAMMVTLGLAGCTGGPDVVGERSLTGYSELTACSLPDAPPAPTFPVATLTTNFGVIKADIFLDMVPVTGQNFIDLAEAGSYDGTSFHRIITDFMMQGGRLESSVPNIQDEFHHELRHVGKGVLSMANAGPNTGNSQFFITFDDTTWLDDKHSVFGQVIEGMDVVDRINAEASAPAPGTPTQDVILESVTIDYDERSWIQGFGALLFTFDVEQSVPAAGGWARFIMVAESTAPGLLPVCVGSDAPAGVTVRVEDNFHAFDIPVGQRVAFIVDVETTGAADVPLILNGPGGELARVDLSIVNDAQPSAVAAVGTTVEGNYIGVTVDGRVFDTSRAEVADFVVENGLAYATFQHRGGQYKTFEFTPGSGVIQGFTTIAVGTADGTSNAGRVEPRDAYGESGNAPLAGRTLLFQLDVVGVT